MRPGTAPLAVGAASSCRPPARVQAGTARGPAASAGASELGTAFVGPDIGIGVASAFVGPDIGIGVVSPFDWELDWELWRWASDRISLFVTRTLPLPEPVGIEMAEHLANDQTVIDAVRAVLSPHPKVVVYACTSGSFVAGVRGEARLRAVMEGAGAPVAVTTSGALLDALRLLGVGRVAVVSPYTEALTGRLVRFLDEAGFDVADVAFMGLDSGIARVTGSSIVELARRVSPTADVVFLACTNLPTYGLIDELERELGKPVLSANLVTIWGALRAAGAVGTRRTERLFQASNEPGALERPEGALHRLAAGDVPAAEPSSPSVERHSLRYQLPLGAPGTGTVGSFEIAWHDDVTGTRGFVVVDRTIGGLATGGVRIRPGVTIDEVRRLARVMTLKAALFGLEVGGAKGGLDADPEHAATAGVLDRFIEALAPLFAGRLWVAAEDLGISQYQLDASFRASDMSSSFHAAVQRQPDPAAAAARFLAAEHEQLGALPVGEAIGGYGVATAVATLAGLDQQPVASLSAVVHGFGSMGGSSALFLHQMGVPVLAVFDELGGVVDRRGLDIPQLLCVRNDRGVIDRSRLDRRIGLAGPDDWVEIEASLLVPAALTDTVGVVQAERLGARYVVEAANAAVTAGGRAVLEERGVKYLPDFVANAGAMLWAWWLITGVVDHRAGSAAARLRAEMEQVVTQVVERAGEGLSLRNAAYELAIAALELAQARHAGECERR